MALQGYGNYEGLGIVALTEATPTTTTPVTRATSNSVRIPAQEMLTEVETAQASLDTEMQERRESQAAALESTRRVPTSTPVTIPTLTQEETKSSAPAATTPAAMPPTYIASTPATPSVPKTTGQEKMTPLPTPVALTLPATPATLVSTPAVTTPSKWPWIVGAVGGGALLWLLLRKG